MNIGIGIGLNRRSGGGDAAIRALFANGEQGVWFDYSDLSTLFQDVAGTVPVTAPGQSVALVKDKSGRGNHATQATFAKRRIYRSSGGLSWLESDGVDDAMQTPNIDFTATDKMTVCAGVTKTSSATQAAVCELGSNSDGGFSMWAPSYAAGGFGFWSKGTVLSSGAITTSPTVPATLVITGQSDISGDYVGMRHNGVLVATSVTDQGTGNYGNLPLNIGARNGTTFFFSGNDYGLIVRGAYSSAGELAAMESYMARKTG